MLSQGLIQVVADIKTIAIQTLDPSALPELHVWAFVTESRAIVSPVSICDVEHQHSSAWTDDGALAVRCSCSISHPQLHLIRSLTLVLGFQAALTRRPILRISHSAGHLGIPWLFSVFALGHTRVGRIFSTIAFVNGALVNRSPDFLSINGKVDFHPR